MYVLRIFFQFDLFLQFLSLFFLPRFFFHHLRFHLGLGLERKYSVTLIFFVVGTLHLHVSFTIFLRCRHSIFLDSLIVYRQLCSLLLKFFIFQSGFFSFLLVSVGSIEQLNQVYKVTVVNQDRDYLPKMCIQPAFNEEFYSRACLWKCYSIC